MIDCLTIAISAPSEGGLRFFMALFSILLAAWLAGTAAKKLGYPSMIGELIVGILLGPPLLGLLATSPDLPLSLKEVANLGVLVMMLYIGLEIDPKEMVKSSGPALMSAVGGFVVPFVMGLGLTWFYLEGELVDGEPITTVQRVSGALLVGMALGVTSLATKSRVLLDLELLDTRLAMVMMVGALFTDTAAMVIFAGITGFAEAGQVSWFDLGMTVGRAVLFFGITIGAGTFLFPLVPKLLKRLHMGGKLSTFTCLLVIMLSFGEVAHWLGLHEMLGAFMAGMFARSIVPDQRDFHEQTELIQFVAIGFLAPVFFVTAGFKFDFAVFTDDLWMLVAVVGIAIFGKIVGTLLFYLPSGNGWREGLVIGAGMNGRGAVEIIVAGIAYDKGWIDGTIFSILVFMAIFTTALVPVGIKWGSDWLRSRGELVRLHERTRMLLVGGGPLARFLAQELKGRVPVTLVDRNDFRHAAAEREDLDAYHGNVLDPLVLKEAGAVESSWIVGMTANPETNLMAVRLGREQFLVPNAAVMLPGKHAKSYDDACEQAGAVELANTVTDPASWDHWLGVNQCGVQRLGIEEPMTVGERTEELGHDRPVLPLLIWRDDRPIIPGAQTKLEKGDELLLLTPEMEKEPEQDEFDRLVERAPVLDLDGPMSRQDFFERVAEEFETPLGIDADTLVHGFEEREAEGGTVIGEGLAIPHLMLPGEDHFELLIARCREGIDFDSDESVTVVFVLAASRDKRNFHLRCLSAVAQIMQDEEFRSHWLEVPGTEELRQLVLEARRNRFHDKEQKG